MEGYCRGCLSKHEDVSQSQQYTEKSRRLFMYSTGLQIKPNDSSFHMCRHCFIKMKLACRFKKQCRTSDKKLNHFLMLRETGEIMDFDVFLKNYNDSFSLKFPLNGTSTPNHKSRDDDNESTCASIQNFMTDILRADDLPDTEAQIIQEMIVKEADMLDDSLDSQWLQDDASVVTDFRFSPFSTPRSKTEMRDYSPVKTNEMPDYSPVQPNEMSDYSPVKTNEISDYSHVNTNEKQYVDQNEQVSPDIDQNMDFDEETYIAAKNILLRSPSPAEIRQTGARKILDPILNHEGEITFSFKKGSSKEDKDLSDEACSPDGKIEGRGKQSCLETNDDTTRNEEFTQPTGKPHCRSTKKGVKIEIICETNSNALQGSSVSVRKKVCVSSDFLKQNNIDSDETIVKDRIDKNLEEALKDENNQEFPLDSLIAIATPSVKSGVSGAATPLIDDILFGGKENGEQPTPHVYCTDGTDEKNIQHNNSEVDVLDDFFNKETGEYIGQTQKEEPKEIFGNFKVPEAPKKDIRILGKAKYDLSDFSCKICEKSFKNVTGLKVHFAMAHKFKIEQEKRSESRQEQFCHKCAKVFHYKSTLRQHMRTVHRTKQEAIHTCKVCSLEFGSATNLKMHMVTHLGKQARKLKNPNAICNICGHQSTSLSNLRVHIARHNKKYSFKCEHCGRAYYRKTDLAVHMRIHTGEKPFECQHCHLKFRRRDQINLHMKRHTGERPFECEHCGLRFFSRNILRNHVNYAGQCLKLRMEKINEIEEESGRNIVAEVIPEYTNTEVENRDREYRTVFPPKGIKTDILGLAKA